MTILVIYEILGLFVNILTADRKYSFFNGKNLEQSIQMQSSEKQKTLPDFFALFLKSTSSFEHFKKLTRTAYLFPKLRTSKDVVR